MHLRVHERVRVCANSLFPPSGRLQYISVKVEAHQPLPLLQAGQGKVHNLVYSVVDGPVKLLRLITGQHQHEPVETSTTLNPDIQKQLAMKKHTDIHNCSHIL